jgi:hypothetical protein
MLVFSRARVERELPMRNLDSLDQRAKALFIPPGAAALEQPE